MEIAAVESSKQFFAATIFAAIGIAMAVGGMEVIVWLAQQFPARDQMIREADAWVIAILICLASLFPILAIYRVVRKQRGSEQSENE